MLVRELMARTLITARPETPVVDARALMAKERVRHLPVIEDERLVGIITDRDIRLNMPSPATSLSVWEVNYLLARLEVGSVMTRLVIVIGPDRDVRDAARLMLGHKIGAVPVVDGDRLVGIITESDIVRAFLEGAPVREPAVAG
jgi:acetoin utilization protein AcuB